MPREHVTVLGAGSWGTALAKLAADAGHNVVLWSRREELAAELRDTLQNAQYLPGVELPANLYVTSDLAEALARSTLLIWVVPSHGLRAVLERSRPLMPPGATHVSCIKGIENESLMLVSEIFEQLLDRESYTRFSVMGGPSFAKEVALGMPTAVCVAAAQHATAEGVQRVLASHRFRVYTSDDVVGVEVGGALKNVIAIAAGCVHGMGLGTNAVAALITRGLAEMSRLAVALGAHPLTLSGLSGAGDSLSDLHGELSRNRALGVALGQGKSVAAVLGQTSMVAEGFRTAKSAHELALRKGVEMPITHTVYQVLYEGRPADETVALLMSRALRPERDDA